MARVIRAGLDAREEDRETLESILQEAILHELPLLQRGLALLAVSGVVAPLLGLLGTVTGMIEVAAIEPMFEKAAAITGKIRHAFYIGADTLTERKNLARFENAARKNSIRMSSRLVPTMSEWIEAYKLAQQADLIIIGSHSKRGPLDVGLGSTASALNHDLPATVLMVRPMAEEQERVKELQELLKPG